MNLELVEILVEYSNYELENYGEYSGRGMFGEKTLAITGDSGTFYEAVKNACLDCTDAEKEILRNFDLSAIRTDSMGYETIFY